MCVCVYFLWVQKVSKQRKSNWDPKYDAKCDLFKKKAAPPPKSVKKAILTVLKRGGGTFDLSNAHSFVIISCLFSKMIFPI